VFIPEDVIHRCFDASEECIYEGQKDFQRLLCCAQHTGIRGMVVEALLVAIYLHRKRHLYTCAIFLARGHLVQLGPARLNLQLPPIQLNQLLPCVAEPATSQQIATEARHTRNILCLER
jgi:hypothetical protein